MNSIDLHTHSNKSDGSLAPSELASLAVQKKLSAVALTDHDCVDGIEEFQNAVFSKDAAPAPDDPYGIGLEAIPGIELSTEYNGRDIHIVGLFCSYEDPDFISEVQVFAGARDLRNKEMCSKMAADGIPITYDDLMASFPDSMVTRAHVARYLLDHGVTSSMGEAFDKYIGDACKYFVPRKKITPEKAVSFIRKYKGIPILAHPFLYDLGSKGLDELAASLKEHGLMGIEAYYNNHTPEMTAQIKGLAEKYDLLLSGGSDFHGSNKPGLELGNGYGHLSVPYECLTKMKHRLYGTSDSTKIFFFDFDGTLSNSQKQISPKTKEALDGFVARGNIFVLSSGRSMPDIKDMVAAAGLDYPHMFFEGYNSAEIYDNDNDITLFRKTMSFDMIRKLFDMAQREGVYLQTYDDTAIIAPKKGEEIDYYTQFNHMDVKFSEDVLSVMNGRPCKCLAIDLNDTQKLIDFGRLVEKEFPGILVTTLSQPKYLEIVPAGIDKGYGVRFLARRLGIPMENTYAAGDANNDIPMLLAAGTGIAMKNSMTGEVLDSADIITETDNDHDGLAPILEKI